MQPNKVCPKCNGEAVWNQALGKDFWYCRTCKEEISPHAPNKREDKKKKDEQEDDTWPYFTMASLAPGAITYVPPTAPKRPLFSWFTFADRDGKYRVGVIPCGYYEVTFGPNWMEVTEKDPSQPLGTNWVFVPSDSDIEATNRNDINVIPVNKPPTSTNSPAPYVSPIIHYYAQWRQDKEWD